MRYLVAALLISAALAGCATDSGNGDAGGNVTRDPASGAGGTPPTAISAPNPYGKKPVNNSTTPTPTPTATPTTTPTPTPTEEPTQPADVAIVGFAFSPATIDVAPGQTIVWTNADTAPHTVTFDTVDSGTLGEGDAFSHAFDAPGTYAYVCEFHSNMQGTVTVA